MSVPGQKRSSLPRKSTSGLPPTTDITRQSGHFRKVPQTDSCTAAINVRSISSETPWLTAPRGTPAVKRLVSSLWLLISARGQPSVRRNGPLEVFIFLAGNEAEVFQRRQLLLCFGRLPKHQISLTEMLMRAAVAGI